MRLLSLIQWVSVQHTKHAALGMFTVTFIFASKRTSVHLWRILLGDNSSLIVNVAFTKCHSPVWIVSGWQLHRLKSPFLTLRIHTIWTTKILRWRGFGSSSIWFASTIRYLHSRISLNLSLQTKTAGEKKVLQTQITGPYYLYHYLAGLSWPSAHYFVLMLSFTSATSAACQCFFRWWLLDPAEAEINP